MNDMINTDENVQNNKQVVTGLDKAATCIMVLVVFVCISVRSTERFVDINRFTPQTGESYDISFNESAAEQDESSFNDSVAEYDELSINESTAGYWQKFASQTPIKKESFGDWTYKYFSSEQISQIGEECCYYHLGVQHGEIEDLLFKTLDNYKVELSFFDDDFSNYYAETETEYYTLFQKQIKFELDNSTCSINYDTGSGNVHYIDLNGYEIEKNTDMVHNIMSLISDEYCLTKEQLTGKICDTAEVLKSIDPPDIWHQEFAYRDSCCGIVITYDDGKCDLQITSADYAQDIVNDNISISKPKY